ncbi:hypothetical protein CB1_000299022 [Camelus ferus]|nr:hypothetical protein CB1_000299022 [Camelus ferus]
MGSVGPPRGYLCCLVHLPFSGGLEDAHVQSPQNGSLIPRTTVHGQYCSGLQESAESTPSIREKFPHIQAPTSTLVFQEYRQH